MIIPHTPKAHQIRNVTRLTSVHQARNEVKKSTFMTPPRKGERGERKLG
jgi:hypothetical protein